MCKKLRQLFAKRIILLVSGISFMINFLSAVADDKFSVVKGVDTIQASTHLPQIADRFLFLQSGTPGVQQHGNISIEGTALFGDNVGIGLSNPQSKLDINGNLLISDPDAFFLINDGFLNRVALNSDSTFPGNSILRLGGGFDIVHTESTTNVGIGTEDPREVLHLFRESPSTVGMLMGNGFTGSGRRGFLVDYHFTNGAELWNFENTDMWFATNDTRRMTIKNNGNVGIGTDEPSETLDVTGTVKAERFVGDGSGLTGITGTTGGVSNINSTTIAADSDDDGIGEIAFQTKGDTKMTVTNNGDVGIGTLNPSEELEVVGTVKATRFIGDGSGLTGIPGGAGLDGHSLDAVDGSPTDAVFVDDDGKVGIGTTSPEAKLEVVGSIKSPMWKVSKPIDNTPGPNPNIGPAPITGSFSSNGGTIILFCSGSGFSNSSAVNIGATVKVDGVSKGRLVTHTNESFSHKSFVSNPIVVTELNEGQHIVSIEANTGTIIDFADFFNVLVMELPF